jgi:hypothetical protein
MGSDQRTCMNVCTHTHTRTTLRYRGNHGPALPPPAACRGHCAARVGTPDACGQGGHCCMWAAGDARGAYRTIASTKSRMLRSSVPALRLSTADRTSDCTARRCSHEPCARLRLSVAEGGGCASSAENAVRCTLHGMAPVLRGLAEHGELADAVGARLHLLHEDAHLRRRQQDLPHPPGKSSQGLIKRGAPTGLHRRTSR